MIKIEKVEYAGWPNCYRLSNGKIELIVTTDIGPRIIRFGYLGKQNELYENPQEVGKMGGDQWRLYGGHRLWHSPEDTIRTYFPDNFPCEFTLLDDGIVLTAPVDTPAGLQKSIEIRMLENEPKVTLLHRIRNVSLWPITFAPWAITVMAQNGAAILPLAPRGGWPKDLLPTYSINFWSYVTMTDPRFTWGDEFIFLRQQAVEGKEQKIGFNNSEGWMGYLRDNHLFIKTFDYFPDLIYPDRGSNCECFTNRDTLELESVAPIQQVLPGQDAAHRETWQVFKDIRMELNEADVKRTVHALLKK